jgi:ABC-type antimicrobial peptide transport system permease subunit
MDMIPVISGIILVTLITALVSGSYPSFVLSSFLPINAIKDSGEIRCRSSFLRKTLVTVQFIVVIVLIIGTTFLYNQLDYMKNKSLGFDRDNLIWLQMNKNRSKNFDNIKEELMQYPEIEGVTWSGESPHNIRSSVWAVEWDGKNPEEKITFNFQYVDYDYLNTLNMEFVNGRNFSRSFSTDKSEAYIVNELAVKIMGMKNPVGKRLSVFRNEGVIIGVVKDFHFQPLNNEIKPFVVAIGNDNWRNNLFIRLNPDNSVEALDVVKNVLAKFDPENSFIYYYFDDLIAYNYQQEERLGSLVRYFTIMLVVVASLGLFGMVSLTVQQHKKEIGIRKVLGASSSELMIMLNKNLAVWIMISNIIAWPLAYYAVTKMFENYAYHTGINPMIFILAAAASLIIGFAATSFKTIKAANINPVNTIKYE